MLPFGALSILSAFGSTGGGDAEKRRLAAISPNFFQLNRPSTQGKRSCPVPPWKAHGFETHETCGACSHYIETMRSVGCASAVVTDKVEAHSYHTMYGIFLLPLRHSPRPVKLLEIGLGCDMHYEPGASASLWPKLLPNAEIWMAEHDAACVQESVRRGWLPGIRTLTGDQSDPAVTARWLRESGGAFDAIIDDGGHSNWQIRSTFSALWPAVKPGGFYFIEDMQAGRNPGWPQQAAKDKEAVVSDIVQAWIEQLTIDPMHVRPSAKKHPLPPDVAFITCQKEACVIAKACTRGEEKRAQSGRRLAAISPNFFQLNRPSTQGKRSCPVPPWKAHGFETHETCGACSHYIETMRSVGCASAVVTDKVEAHSYHTMYGIFLLPLRHSPRPVKLLEIGLGCDMHYEPGASASLWPKLLPNAEIWMAEHDAACVQESVRRGWLPGIRTLTGDQSDPAVTARWLRESGGAFDAIIDDGGHSNWQIRSTFSALWPAVKPGGFYFIEDMQAGRNPGWPQQAAKDKEAVVSDIVQAWIEQLTIDPMHVRPSAKKHPLPPDVAFITCQKEACVIAKACTRGEGKHHPAEGKRPLHNSSHAVRHLASSDDKHVPPLSPGERACMPRESDADTGTKRKDECRRWLLGGGGKPEASKLYLNTPLYPGLASSLALVEHTVVKKLAKQLSPDAGRTRPPILFVYAACASSNYALDATRFNLAQVRANYPESIILMSLCGTTSFPEDIVYAADGVIRAPCASARGYDSGLWQQALAYARTLLDWAALGGIFLVNDSVLGPLYRMAFGRGLTGAACWKFHVMSSSVQAYPMEIAGSRVFAEFWNQTEFVCNKIGSMLQLEATLYSRYQRADAPCSTYTNDIDKFQHPPVGDGPWNAKDYPALPFYKHKNDNGFRDAYARSGKEVFTAFASKVWSAQEAKPAPLQKCDAQRPQQPK